MPVLTEEGEYEELEVSDERGAYPLIRRSLTQCRRGLTGGW